MGIKDSRFEKYYKFNPIERLDLLKERLDFQLSDEEIISLQNGSRLSLEKADHMIENVIGIFGLPYAIATNFLIDGKDYIVPMVVEEPSIVAAASFMAKLVRQAGGFTTSYTASLMTAQIHVTNLTDPYGAAAKILEQKADFIEVGNSVDKTLVSLGGGIRDIWTRIFSTPHHGLVLAIHLVVDVLDAMGANTVNTIAERLAPKIVSSIGGLVSLRILSNLADLRIARARVSVPIDVLETNEYSGEEVAAGIVRAYEIADNDIYRATTHNKGIMNGIDPIMVATGNDWRAIEAGAHAYAARDGHYRSMSTWERGRNGELVGTLELPMAVGIIGGATKAHPLAQLSLRLMGITKASELARLAVAVGLAQNMAALRVLSTEGVQRGHMELHARNVVSEVGLSGELAEKVLAKMIEEHDVRYDRAVELAKEFGQ